MNDEDIEERCNYVNNLLGNVYRILADKVFQGDKDEENGWLARMELIGIYSYDDIKLVNKLMDVLDKKIPGLLHRVEFTLTAIYGVERVPDKLDEILKEVMVNLLKDGEISDGYQRNMLSRIMDILYSKDRLL